MAEPSIFADEWRECLRAHYTYVVRMNDRGTERTLHGVMLEAGFSEDEVRQLYVLASAHVDDMPDDFAPDTSLLEAEAAYVQAVIAPETVAPEPVALETVEPEPEAIEVIQVEVIEDALDAEDEDQGDADEPPPNDPDITQLSLF